MTNKFRKKCDPERSSPISSSSSNRSRNGQMRASSPSPSGASTSALSIPFAKSAKVHCSQKNFSKIRLRKTRWEPLPEEMAAKLQMKPQIRRKRSEPVQSQKDLQPLFEFIDNRKQLAREIMDSLDRKTCDKIFPELKNKTVAEKRRIIHSFLEGMSRKRILAVMQKKDLSDSSSTSESEEYIDDHTCASYSSSSNDARSKTSSCTMREKLETGSSEKSQKKSLNRNKQIEKAKDNGDLEDGELRSSGEENGWKGQSSTTSLVEDLTGEIWDMHSKGMEYDGGGSDTYTQKPEPQFIISLDFSSLPGEEPILKEPEKYNGGGEDEFEQQIVCIFPQSPVSLDATEGNTEFGEKSDAEANPFHENLVIAIGSDNEHIRANSSEENAKKLTEDEREEGELEDDGREEERGQFISSDGAGESTFVGTLSSDNKMSDEEIGEPDIELIIE